MTPDVVFEMGSMLAKAIPLAMAFVALGAGGIMLFDALRLYRNRKTKVEGCSMSSSATDSPPKVYRRSWQSLDDSSMDSATDPPTMAFELAATDPKRESARAYRQSHFFRK